MARGGSRSNSGRKKGQLAKHTRALNQRLRASTATTTAAKLQEVVDDPAVDVDVALLACRKLFLYLVRGTPGETRSRNAANEAYREFRRRLTIAEGNISEKMAGIAADSSAPLNVRLIAARHAMGAVLGATLN